MSQKRQPEDGATGSGSAGGGGGGGGGSPDEKRQKVPALRRVIMEVIKNTSIQSFLREIEPFVRKIVKEEVQSALINHFPSMSRQGEMEIVQKKLRTLQLQFKNKLSLPIFTGSRIEGDDCSAITIALVDALTGEVVSSGQASSIKVEVVVLEGDFVGDEEDNWAFEEFKNNIVREREGKRPLLAGEVFIELNAGTGTIRELMFTDNSSWTRGRKFRIGARTADGYLHGMRIREAITESFMVKDHRGELYKKHYPPLLGDEVWRLEKIGKDGAFHKRLSIMNIDTVKDFLTSLCLDPTKLRNILGNGMSDKMWEVTVEHARTCILPPEFNVYYTDSQRTTGVAFNVVGDLAGLLFEQHFVSVEELSDKQKEEAHQYIKVAYENWNNVTICDRASLISTPSNQPLAALQPAYPFLPDNADCNSASPLFSLSRSNMPLSPNIFSVGFEPELPAGICHGSCKGSRVLKDYSPMIYDECSSQAFFCEDSFQYLDSGLSSQSITADMADLGAELAGFMALPVGKACAHPSGFRGWSTLSTVVQWILSIKRIVALKRRG